MYAVERYPDRRCRRTCCHVVLLCMLYVGVILCMCCIQWLYSVYPGFYIRVLYVGVFRVSCETVR